MHVNESESEAGRCWGWYGCVCCSLKKKQEPQRTTPFNRIVQQCMRLVMLRRKLCNVDICTDECSAGDRVTGHR